MSKRKPFEELTIQDDFMFCKVMQDVNICKRVLQLVLGEEIPKIVSISSQETIQNHSELKSVRLDVLAKDEKENNFNVEMQLVNNDKIPKRMRLYQATIDVYIIKKGMSYASMSNTIIVFFCMFDPISKGLPIYTFANTCQEDKNIKLNDGTLKVIINVKAYEKVKNIELRNLLKYICDGIPTDSLTEEIDMSIGKIKQNLAYIEEYKSFSARMQDEREEGREEGRKEGLQEGSEQRNIYLAKSFRDMGVSLDKIAQATGLTQAEIQKL